MIKINLGSKKGPVAADSGGEDRASSKALGLGLFSRASEGGGPEDRKVLIRKLLILAVVYFGCDFAYKGYEEEEKRKVTVVINKLKADQKKLTVTLEESKGFEEQKRLLDRDEQMMKAKIETLEKLSQGRSSPPEVLKFIAMNIPQDAWLTELTLEDTTAQFKGLSKSLGLVSDFMKSLGESTHFMDLDFKAGSRNDQGEELATFELKAKRRIQ